MMTMLMLAVLASGVPSGVAASERSDPACYSVTSTPDPAPPDWKGYVVDYPPPAALILHDTPNASYVQESGYKRLSGPGMPEEFDGQASWKIEHQVLLIDWGNGLGGIGMELAKVGAGWSGTGKPYSDSLDSGVMYRTYRVDLAPMDCVEPSHENPPE